MGLSPLSRFGLIALVIALVLNGCGDHREQAGEQHGSAAALRAPQRTVPVFSGIDANGAPFNAGTLRGTYWLASFFFTSCETICPALNTVQKRLQDEFGQKIKFVSITTDPDTDTPERLHDYAAQYGALNGRWMFVRMSADSMRSLSRDGFALMEPTDPSMHSTRFALVDDSMRVRDYFDSADTAEVTRLRTVLRGL